MAHASPLQHYNFWAVLAACLESLRGTAAPIHVAVLPIYRKDYERTAVLEAANRIAGELRADGLTVEVDDREGMKPGAKYYHWEQRGVPIRLERGRPKKESLPWEGLGVAVAKRLDAFQTLLDDRALARREAKTVHVDSWDEFTDLFKDSDSSFVWAHWDGTSETELATKATIRCIPYESDGPAAEPGVCIKTGNPSAQRVLFSKSH